LADWAFEPGVVLALGALTGWYVVGIRRLRPKTIWDEQVVSVGELVCFSIGILLLVMALISPIDTLSNQMFSAHMLQHMVLIYLAPPLLLAGIPAWLLDPLLDLPYARPTLRFVTAPITALVIFNGVLVLWHMPQTWQAALVDPQVHALEHLMMLLAGLIAWWPIFSPTPAVPRLSYPAQCLYLFVQSLVPAVIGAFMTFSGIVIYPIYGETPKLWGLSPLVDQQIAGLEMKLLGTIFLWVLVTIRFFQWFNHEEHEDEKLIDDGYSEPERQVQPPRQ
jgi:putative membrane protein